VIVRVCVCGVLVRRVHMRVCLCVRVCVCVCVHARAGVYKTILFLVCRVWALRQSKTWNALSLPPLTSPPVWSCVGSVHSGNVVLFLSCDYLDREPHQ